MHSSKSIDSSLTVSLYVVGCSTVGYRSGVYSPKYLTLTYTRFYNSDGAGQSQSAKPIKIIELSLLQEQ